MFHDFFYRKLSMCQAFRLEGRISYSRAHKRQLNKYKQVQINQKWTGNQNCIFSRHLILFKTFCGSRTFHKAIIKPRFKV